MVVYRYMDLYLRAHIGAIRPEKFVGFKISPEKFELSMQLLLYLLAIFQQSPLSIIVSESFMTQTNKGITITTITQQLVLLKTRMPGKNRQPFFILKGGVTDDHYQAKADNKTVTLQQIEGSNSTVKGAIPSVCCCRFFHQFLKNMQETQFLAKTQKKLRTMGSISLSLRHFLHYKAYFVNSFKKVD